MRTRKGGTWLVPEVDAQAAVQRIAELEDELLRELYVDPRIGEPMRERFNLTVLAGCRKVLFDEPEWKGKPRFRFVFRNEPDDGAVSRITVLAIGPRQDLAAYRRAAAGHRRTGT